MNTLECLTKDDLMMQQYNFTDCCREDLVIIDIRTPSEYSHEHIKNSINIPLSDLADTDWSPYKNKQIIFYCQSGKRTEQALKVINNISCAKKYWLKCGLDDWRACKLPIERNTSAPIDLMRQVQIIAGVLIIIGTLLSYYVSAYFVVITAFIGCGLVFAGITGFCGMAKLLLMLPFNRPKL